ncbi:proline-rich transmembrane protein 4-like [Actinia tenebrosa]|uniref:Proline-rich transmembrane protein 4-like n=1 Tax=Actinia tenebrosa TaxID=6105 RepID=A0A6P8J2W9_ACTTE|nr:proline-rich transmembrane protein 4-like [Actinia tenebrosa]XP_031574307.1 proline-rich transmembrane protein 4-like [Actinia tenebrosa]
MSGTPSSSPEYIPFSSAEPERSPTSEPEASLPNSAAEPIPEWDTATVTWEWFWDVHWIGLGCLFTILALYSLWSVLNVARESKKRSRVVSIFICSMIFVLGSSRALFLFINPYESPQCHMLSVCPFILTRILFGLGLPCLTAAFSFIQLVFLQVVKLKLYPRKVQNWKFLLTIVMIHFSLALVIEIVVFLYADWRSLSLVCQAFFIVFSLVLSTSFIYTGRKIIHRVNQSARQVSKMGTRSVNAKNIAKNPSRKPGLSKLVRITFLTAALGFISCALQLYSIFVVYDMYRSTSKREPEPWPWLVFQTLYRIVELLAGITMGYVCPRQANVQKKSPMSPCWSTFEGRKRRYRPAVFYTDSGTTDPSVNHSTELELL